MNANAGVLSLSGYGLRVTVERGHLCIEDGIGDERRRARFSRVPRKFNRVVVLGHSGFITFEALRWIQDVGATFIHIDSDGQLIAAGCPSGLNEAKLRRSQALALTNGLAVEIARELIRQKLEEQTQLMKRLPEPVRAHWDIEDCWSDLNKAQSIEEIRVIEARVAVMYWSAWPEIGIEFDSGNITAIPEHWLRFGSRKSLLSQPSARRATNPANAILNYLYAILEAEARIAALQMGLDPGLGFLHADQGSRDSLPCDLMEPIRPKVDAYVLDLLRSRRFRKSDFFETREGICRLMPPLARELADTARQWAKQLGPVTEAVAKTLYTQPKKSERLPTVLTERNRSDGRKVQEN
jgi:CRISPR-associated endonuclease Cas1